MSDFWLEVSYEIGLNQGSDSAIIKKEHIRIIKDSFKRIFEIKPIIKNVIDLFHSFNDQGVNLDRFL